MKKLFFGMLMFFIITGSAWAGQCDDDPNYDYSKGHRIVSSPLSSSIVSNLKVCIDSSVPTLWSNAINQAILKLNSNLSSVDTILNYSSATSNCFTTVRYTNDFTNNSIAEVRSVGHVYINSDYSPSSFSDVKMKFTMMHELLHLVGFMHTGWNVHTEVQDTDSYWTTKYMPASIMCGVNSSSYPSLEFNAFDKLAIETLYPN